MIYKALSVKVRGMRFELTRPFERYHLKVVRLPISPPTQQGRFPVKNNGRNQWCTREGN